MKTAQLIRVQLIHLMRFAGRRFTIVHLEPGAYNNDTGETSTPTESKHYGWGRLGTYSDKLVNGTTIFDADRLLTFIPDDITFVPGAGDFLDVSEDGARYSLVGPPLIREIGGEVIAYSIQVRSGPSG